MKAKSSSSADTEELGAKLAQKLGPGDVVFLYGELGSGKTTFVRGAARALGVTSTVRSPTFTIGALYDGRVPVAHLDLYRLAGGTALEDPGVFEEYLDGNAVVFIEWPELIGSADFVRPTVSVRLSHVSGDTRRVEIEQT